MTTFEGPPLAEVEGVGALTMGGFLTEVVDRFGAHEALVLDDALHDGATVRWSYAELGAQARRIGRSLVALGVEPGEPVGILMGDRPEAVAALFGASMAGALAVPLSTFAPPAELGPMLDKAAIRVVLTQDRLRDRRLGDEVERLAAAQPDLRRTVALGSPGWATFLAEGEEVDDHALDVRMAAVSPDDPGLVIFSSGTTSEPKAMLHRHRAAALQFWVQAQIFGRDTTTRMFCALPIFWTAGLNTAMGATLAAGGCWVMQEVFDPDTALPLLARERVTEPYTLPHQTAALAEHPAWLATDLSSLRCVFGKSAYARHPSVDGDTGWIMPVGYGLSETCAFFASHRSSTPRAETRIGVGPLLPGNRLRIVDPDSGRPLGIGEEGEIAVAGPTLMIRYLGSAAEDCVDADGFFHTGDAGHVDAAGILHFSGRRTEMIKTGGANVSPAEIEVQLRACAPVKLARIVGVPDPRLDQIVVACITLADGATATEDDIRSFLRERIAPYKVPRRVLFFADGEIPMTTSDTKVRDEELLALVHQRLAADPVPLTRGAR